jgi:hypothetical protein
MTKRSATILMIGVGLLVFVCVLGLGGGAWFYKSHFFFTDTTEPQATRQIESARARFKGATPIFELEDDHVPVVRRRPAEGSSPRQLTSLRILSFNPEDEEMSDVTLPFWLLRMKPSFDVYMDFERKGGHVNVSVADIERYGPDLLLDATVDRQRYLVWTE